MSSDKSYCKKHWSFVNWLPKGVFDVKRAVLLHSIVTVITFLFVYFKRHLKIWSAIIFSLIIGQVVLNVFFMPDKLNFWSEFDSWTAIYGLLQLLTPTAVFAYAIIVSINDVKHNRVR